MPWHGRQVADFLVLMLGMKQAAATTKDAKLSGEVQGWADGGVKWAIDEFCGTPPYPWPPGPPIRVLELASLLAVIANAMPAGDLKTSLTDLSGSVLKQSIGTSAR